MFTILRIDAHATADRMPTEYAALAASGRTDVVLKQADAETPEQLVAAAQEADVADGLRYADWRGAAAAAALPRNYSLWRGV